LRTLRRLPPPDGDPRIPVETECTMTRT
jgi:hypothetical protein